MYDNKNAFELQSSLVIVVVRETELTILMSVATLSNDVLTMFLNTICNSETPSITSIQLVFKCHIVESHDLAWTSVTNKSTSHILPAA